MKTEIKKLKFEWNNKKCEFTGEYIFPTPDVWYLRNGDPGYPGDPSELGTIKELIIDSKKLSDQEIDILLEDDNNYISILELIEKALAKKEDENAKKWIEKNCKDKDCGSCSYNICCEYVH